MNKMHTYFVSFVSCNNDDHTTTFGNKVFATESTGTQLYADARNMVESILPGAILMSISKLD